jgi:hypothetical protein
VNSEAEHCKDHADSHIAAEVSPYFDYHQIVDATSDKQL